MTVCWPSDDLLVQKISGMSSRGTSLIQRSYQGKETTLSGGGGRLCTVTQSTETIKTAEVNEIADVESVTTDAIHQPIPWEFEASAPSWLQKAFKEHQSLTSQIVPTASGESWMPRSQHCIYLVFCRKCIFLELNDIFSSALNVGRINDWTILEPAVERCLQTLARKACFGARSIRRRLPSDTTPHVLVEEADYSDIDVGFVLDLLRFTCEMFVKGIPQRQNSERDIYIFTKAHIFSCLDGTFDRHL
ncbi:hypothetical protein BC938DRAFT_477465 [Jimgerdemannia flammicorona]|uniref:Uncharacterized protein n=1 Tax=Jimgerdemannia flammicorona TaxID=994334 RepID=A0A433QP95_9FUNG|nr:hypothetical protein BC938DRAFT_477465 [Jimgerdemannia flammicorona]